MDPYNFDDVNNAQTLNDQQSHLRLAVDINHVVSDETKNGQGKRNKASAKVSGAGRADINSAYRFSVVSHGQGVHEVLPMASNVVLGYIRRRQ
jgi:hypothetical protein